MAKGIIPVVCAIVVGATVSAVSAEEFEAASPPLFGCSVQMGACCLPTGECIEVGPDECDGQGGIYQGDFTPCDDPGLGITCTPFNDECEGAFPIGIGQSLDGSTFGANPDDVPPCGPPTEGGAFGVWYSVIGNGEVLMACTCTAGVDQSVANTISIFCSCGATTCVAGSEPCQNILGEGAMVQWCSEPGVEYKILVRTLGFEAPFTLEVISLKQPCKAFEPCQQTCGADHCEDAGEICPGETYLVDTFGATSDYIDHGGTVEDVFFCGPFFGIYDVWCNYTPDDDGLLFVHIEGPSGVGTEWVFGIYDGCSPSPEAGEGPQLLACNTALHHGVIVWEVQGGRTYWIRSAARGFARGEFLLEIVGPPCQVGAAASHGPDACPADVNGDGVVDPVDLVEVLREARPCPLPADCPSDVDGNGIVDAKDITSVLTHLGSDCTPG